MVGDSMQLDSLGHHHEAVAPVPKHVLSWEASKAAVRRHVPVPVSPAPPLSCNIALHDLLLPPRRRFRSVLPVPPLLPVPWPLQLLCILLSMPPAPC